MSDTPTPPDFAAQVSREDADRVGGPQHWVQGQRWEMHAKGATWYRAAHNEEHDLFLLEGWKTRPTVEPEPFFFLTNA